MTAGEDVAEALANEVSHPSPNRFYLGQYQMH